MEFDEEAAAADMLTGAAPRPAAAAAAEAPGALGPAAEAVGGWAQHIAHTAPLFGRWCCAMPWWCAASAASDVVLADRCCPFRPPCPQLPTQRPMARRRPGLSPALCSRRRWQPLRQAWPRQQLCHPPPLRLRARRRQAPWLAGRPCSRPPHRHVHCERCASTETWVVLQSNGSCSRASRTQGRTALGHCWEPPCR